jgi:hypothetical protein
MALYTRIERKQWREGRLVHRRSWGRRNGSGAFQWPKMEKEIGGGALIATVGEGLEEG